MLPGISLAQKGLTDAEREQLREKYFISGVDNRILMMWVNVSYGKPMFMRTNPKHDGLSWREREVGQNVRLFGLEPEGTINADLTLRSLPDSFYDSDSDYKQNRLRLFNPLSLKYQIGRTLQSDVSQYMTRYADYSGFTDDLALDTFCVFLPSKGTIHEFPLPKYTYWERFHCYLGHLVIRFSNEEKAAAEIERRAEAKKEKASE